MRPDAGLQPNQKIVCPLKATYLMYLLRPLPKECLFHSSSILPPHWPKSGLPSSASSAASTFLAGSRWKLLSTHSKVILPDRSDISRRKVSISHSCALCQSMILATCFGFASSRAVLTSKLAKYNVGLTTVPCLITGFLSSCHSQCLL